MTGSSTVPGPGGPPAATPRSAVDEAVTTLVEAAPRWSATGPAPRAELLRATLSTVLDAGPDWAANAASIRAAGTERAVADAWASGVVPVLRLLAALETTLRDVAAHGRPRPPGIRTDAASGRVVVDVFPAERTDRLLFPGVTGEVRLADGVTSEQTLERLGRAHRPDAAPRPGLALVLADGAISSAGPMDALHQLFVEGRVVLLKLPLTAAALVPTLTAAFEPLIVPGLLRIVRGGAGTGAYLVDHGSVDVVHLSGTDATHDTIGLDVDAAGRERRRRDRARRRTTLTSEFGSIAPVIVVPGPWSEDDLAHQGDNVASMVVTNAGLGCAASRVVVQHRAWSRRQALVDAIRRSLRRAEVAEPGDPDAVARWRAFTRERTTAEWFGEPAPGQVPFTLVPDVDPEAMDDLVSTTETFCGLLGEVALDTPLAIDAYLDEAVAFCNDRLWGSLAATLLVHPRSRADPVVAHAVERAIDRLDYGTVVVNHYPGVAYALASTPWGSAPRSRPDDLDPVRRFVHNPYLLEDVAKSVVRGPFRSPITPPWFHTHRRAAQLYPRVARLIATRRRAEVPGVLWHTWRG